MSCLPCLRRYFLERYFNFCLFFFLGKDKKNQKTKSACFLIEKYVYYNHYYNKECLAYYCGKRKQRVWTFPLLVYVVLLHYLFLLCKMTTRPIWLGTQWETGVDAGPALLSLVRVSAGWCSFLSPASNWVQTKISVKWFALDQMHFSISFWQERLGMVFVKWFSCREDIIPTLKSCWELGRGTQIEWPGCILICGAVLFLGLMGVRLVWSLPAAPNSPPPCVSVSTLLSDLHVW